MSPLMLKKIMVIPSAGKTVLPKRAGRHQRQGLAPTQGLLRGGAGGCSDLEGYRSDLDRYRSGHRPGSGEST